jgi:hypothetical protein
MRRLFYFFFALDDVTFSGGVVSKINGKERELSICKRPIHLKFGSEDIFSGKVG